MSRETSDGRQWLCTESKTPLERIDSDGARCGNRVHWHRRLGNGFAGARPQPLVLYRDVPPEPMPLPQANGRVEGGD